MAVQNLGQIGVFFRGNLPPSNTDMIWLDTSTVPRVFRSYNEDTSQWENIFKSDSLVDSVNGMIGDVVIQHDDIPDFDTGVRENRLDQMAEPTENVLLNNQQLKNVRSPSENQDAIRLIDIWQAEISSELGLVNQQANTFEPFFIQDVIPNVAIGVWTITPPFDGQLEISLSGVCSLNSTGSDMIIQVLRDGSLVDFPYQIEPKDSAGTGISLPTVVGGVLGPNVNTGTNQRMPFSGHKVIDVTLGVPVTLELQFTSDAAGLEAAIYSAQIIAKRFINRNT